MESLEAQPSRSSAASAARGQLPSPHLVLAILSVAALLAVFMGLGWNWGDPPGATSGLQPKFRYVNSGWISPRDWQEYGPFSNELRAAVIVSQGELDAFESGYISKVTRGNVTSLGRIDFETSVLLAAYYVWRPVKGDPLTVADLVIKGERASVVMNLDEDAQGREYAYLYAPLIVVVVERSLFPEGEELEFVFELADHPAVTLTATPN